MAWFWLFLGGISEIFWAYGLKASEGFTKPGVSILTILCMILSFYLFAKSLRLIPIGTGYSIFTGIGAAGTVLVGAILLNEELNLMSLLFLILLITGIIGLKMTTKEEEVLDTDKR